MKWLAKSRFSFLDMLHIGLSTQFLLYEHYAAGALIALFGSAVSVILERAVRGTP